MATPRSVVQRSEFSRRLLEGFGDDLPERSIDAMYAHYLELAHWGDLVSLVADSTWPDAIERHFVESLHGLSLLPADDGLQVVDVGSGGGFPGLPLLAARPGLDLTLVESKQKKWAFLRAAARRAALPCHCLNARVGRALPRGFPDAFGAVLVRAVRLQAAEWSALFQGADRERVAIVWAGREDPELPQSLAIVHEKRISGSLGRRIVTIRNNK